MNIRRIHFSYIVVKFFGERYVNEKEIGVYIFRSDQVQRTCKYTRKYILTYVRIDRKSRNI